jgi:hypothetical protein
MSIRTHYSELPAEQVFVLYQMGGFANTSEQELQIKADKEYKELVVAQELIKNSQPEDEFSYCVVVFNPPAAEEAAEILLQSLNLPPTMDNILLLGQNEKTTVQEIIEINRPTRNQTARGFGSTKGSRRT